MGSGRGVDGGLLREHGVLDLAVRQREPRLAVRQRHQQRVRMRVRRRLAAGRDADLQHLGGGQERDRAQHDGESEGLHATSLVQEPPSAKRARGRGRTVTFGGFGRIRCSGRSKSQTALPSLAHHFSIVSECFGNVYSNPFPLVFTLALRVTGRTTVSLPKVCVALRSGLFSSHTLTGPEGAPATFSTRVVMSVFSLRFRTFT